MPLNSSEPSIPPFDGRGPLNEPLDRWTRQFPRGLLASTFGWADLPIADQRNRAWRHFLDTDSTWLLMMDDDQVPVPQTDELFTTPYPYPVMGARYFGKHGREVHEPDGDVGCGCLLVNRVAADMIGDDPFTRQPDEACECLAFCRRAQQAGFWPHKRGRIGHRCLVDVLPADEDGYKIRFPTAEALSRHAPKEEPARFDQDGHLLSGPKWLREQLAAQRPLRHGGDPKALVLPPRDTVGLQLGGGIVTEQTFV